MDHFDFSADNLSQEALLSLDYDSRSQRYPLVSNSNWPLLDHTTMSHNHLHDVGPTGSHEAMPATTRTAATATTTSSSSATATAVTSAPLHTTALDYQNVLDPSTSFIAAGWQYPALSHPPQPSFLDTSLDVSYTGYGGPIRTSPVDFMPVTTAAMTGAMAMDSTPFNLAFPGSLDSMGSEIAFRMNDCQQELFSMNEAIRPSDFVSAPSIHTGSPTDTLLELEIRSLSSSDNGFAMVDFEHRRSFDSFTGSPTNPFIDPSQTVALHVRANSQTAASETALSTRSFGSWEEVPPFPLHSPDSEVAMDFGSSNLPHGLPAFHSEPSPRRRSPTDSPVSPSAVVDPVPIRPSNGRASASTSSPPTRRRKSPVAKVTKAVGKKPAPHSTKADNVAEKRVGRRKGPLRPDQRQQAHEIRKLRACLRCKFLKKTCDKGDPCGGCKPSHARLWQVPCARIDIKDIAYFMKDWKADFERHVTLGFSVGNIKGFSAMERPLYITHGYGYFLPITAREVYVRDEGCFGMDWVESIHETPLEFEVTTAKLSAGMEGVSQSLLSTYLDRHIDGGFERFVDDYFEGTKFLTEILKTAYRFYLREKLPVIRKALKLVLAYNLTLHVTLVEGLSEEELAIGKIDDDGSKFNGKTVAPVMINFQVKCALADLWRELQKDILEELSALFSSVYSGEKLKNWPTIFMLAAILLAIWEEMQFDCHYRVADQAAVEKFCKDMETIPVGVIVGLFSAISQKLPAFNEWDTGKHHHLLNSNEAVCDAMTEVRAHVAKYESYLKSRSEAKFDRTDFDCLSNKFLSKLVIRAN